jgi:hypothetical protein
LTCSEVSAQLIGLLDTNSGLINQLNFELNSMK